MIKYISSTSSSSSKMMFSSSLSLKFLGMSPKATSYKNFESLYFCGLKKILKL